MRLIILDIAQTPFTSHWPVKNDEVAGALVFKPQALS